jgi:hypothetical protein
MTVIDFMTHLTVYLTHLTGIAKFMPLLRADKGEAVPVLELKMALARAIEVIIDKINVSGDRTSRDFV